MAGGWDDPKTANAAAKSAEMVLDRSGFPKVSRRFISRNETDTRDVMPPLDELLAKAQPHDVAKITENYLEAIRRLDAMRSDAREVIDVRPGESVQSSG
jgi:hypothetical protein